MEALGSVASAVAALAALAAVVVAAITVRDGRRSHKDVVRLRKIDQLSLIAEILESAPRRRYGLPALTARLGAALAALEALGGPRLESTESIVRRGLRGRDAVDDIAVNCLSEVERELSAIGTT